MVKNLVPIILNIFLICTQSSIDTPASHSVTSAFSLLSGSDGVLSIFLHRCGPPPAWDLSSYFSGAETNAALLSLCSL